MISLFYAFVLAVWIIIIGMLVQLWYFVSIRPPFRSSYLRRVYTYRVLWQYGVITDADYGLVLAVYTVLIMVLLSQVFHGASIANPISRLMGPLDTIHDDAMIGLLQAHIRHFVLLTREHAQAVLRLEQVNSQLKSKMDSMQAEYDLMTGLYQDQMRTLEERDARVAYLEGKLNESGRRYSTSNAATTMAPPYSAPAGQSLFSDLPFGSGEN
ncbi:hypothetical protein IQ07DRAFT_661293 [Pyrenochaeta sp. DS3sAY3a]|nr:hypothetical protein IQ07DRAFT_661293 [Pyrenochaeta sp. DS3sAY3a]